MACNTPSTDPNEHAHNTHARVPTHAPHKHARAPAGALDAFEFVTFGAPEALCGRGVCYYEVTLLAAAKKGINDVQAGPPRRPQPNMI